MIPPSAQTLIASYVLAVRLIKVATLSSLAIGLAGLPAVAIGQPIPCFDPTISKSKTDSYKSLAKAFLNRNTTGPASSLKV
ncbi:hypothetical protein MAM1_0010c01072 [Mucor ambiguus]|uniref:Uncharacterized protein n=1 Tax=Mucor ambiguus TaxID=91626 RepID=A0A0C9MI64_9FUNG|nr:hypothetical protein MAM1_0010c01072 [Mucor ambiguus]